MLRNLRMVVTLSITSAWVTQGLLFIIMWAHSFSGHKLVSHTDTVLLTLSLGQSFEPVIQLLHLTSNLQATVNTWYVSPLFFFGFVGVNVISINFITSRSRFHTKTTSGVLNYLIAKMYVVLIFHDPFSFFFFFWFDSIQIGLRSADGSAKQRWTFTSYTPE